LTSAAIPGRQLRDRRGSGDFETALLLTATVLMSISSPSAMRSLGIASRFRTQAVNRLRGRPPFAPLAVAAAAGTERFARWRHGVGGFALVVARLDPRRVVAFGDLDRTMFEQL
jgi:hypothetical protein